MSDHTDKLPKYRFVMPGQAAALAIGFFVCGPLAIMFYMLFFVIFGK